MSEDEWEAMKHYIDGQRTGAEIDSEIAACMYSCMCAAAIRRCQAEYRRMIQHETAHFERSQLIQAGSQILAQTQRGATCRPPAEVERAAMKAVAEKMKETLKTQIARDDAAEVRLREEKQKAAAAAKQELERTKQVEKSQAAFKADVAKKKAEKASAVKQHQKKLMEEHVQEMLKYEMEAVKVHQQREEERLSRRWKDPETEQPRPELTLDQIRARHARRKQELRQQYQELAKFLSKKMENAEAYRNFKQDEKAQMLRRKFDASQIRVQKASLRLESMLEDMQPKLDASQEAARQRRQELQDRHVQELKARGKERDQKIKKAEQVKEAEAADAGRRAEALKREADEKAQKALQLIDSAHVVDPVKTLVRSLRLAGVQDAVERQKREDAFRRQRQAEKLHRSMQRFEEQQAKQEAARRRQARVAHKVMLEKHRNADKLFQLNITNNTANLRAQLAEHESDEEAVE